MRFLVTAIGQENILRLSKKELPLRKPSEYGKDWEDDSNILLKAIRTHDVEKVKILLQVFSQKSLCKQTLAKNRFQERFYPGVNSNTKCNTM